MLGRALVRRLSSQSEVRVLSRRPPQGPGFVRGDLETGEGLAEAVDGVDVIAHCASAADYRRPQRDVTQTRRLVDASTATRPHLAYISIVGVDRVPFGFFKAKLAAERVIEESGSRMAELVLGPSAGRVRELGGPHVETMADLMRTYLAAAHRRRRVVRVPVPGKLGAAFGVGDHLLTDGDRGTVTFAEYLRANH